MLSFVLQMLRTIRECLRQIRGIARQLPPTLTDIASSASQTRVIALGCTRSLCVLSSRGLQQYGSWLQHSATKPADHLGTAVVLASVLWIYLAGMLQVGFTHSWRLAFEPEHARSLLALSILALFMLIFSVVQHIQRNFVVPPLSTCRWWRPWMRWVLLCP